MSINNDILIPEPAYYSEKQMFSGRDFWGDWAKSFKWKNKINGLLWRGSATGAVVQEDNWQDLHRHRFVSLLNASNTVVTSAAHDDSDTRMQHHHQQWLSQVADVSFTKLMCESDGQEQLCDTLASHYQVAPPMKMRDQYRWKYLPDIDGNSLSGRFRAFLRSNSAVMKATIFTEWHDARLTAWKHYIPIDVLYRDIFSVTKYFLGDADWTQASECAHDREGEKIASDGSEWADQVLRKEDMLLYLHRVLLEYARLIDDERDRLGYVQDLLDEASKKT